MLENIISRLTQIGMGDALDLETTFGPLASAWQCADVMHIETADDEGARRVSRARKVLPESGGFFVAPTMFRNVSPTARIGFGPGPTAIPFEDKAEATRFANRTMYGLVAYVWTASLSTGIRMAKGLLSLRSDQCGGPRCGTCSPCVLPLSHLVNRESARREIPGMESYLHRQLVCIKPRLSIM